LPPPQLVGLLLNLRKCTVQDELDGFWDFLRAGASPGIAGLEPAIHVSAGDG